MKRYLYSYGTTVPGDPTLKHLDNNFGEVEAESEEEALAAARAEAEEEQGGSQAIWGLEIMHELPRRTQEGEHSPE